MGPWSLTVRDMRFREHKPHEIQGQVGKGIMGLWFGPLGRETGPMSAGFPPTAKPCVDWAVDLVHAALGPWQGDASR